MRNFIVGVVATLVALALVALAAIEFGLVPSNADAKPSGLERWAATTALKRAIAHDENSLHPPAALANGDLVQGVKLYAANCAFCHGASDGKASVSAQGFYIEAPQLATDGVEDDPASVTFWKLKHGIRFTAMPAFGDRLDDDQLWKITAFVKAMDKLPEPVQAEWKRVPSALAAAAAPAASPNAAASR